MQNENDALLNALSECIETCNNCYNSCLQEEDVKMLVRCIRLDRDCADICALTHSMLSSGSEFTNEIKKLCAEVCDACAQECSNHEHEHCRQCEEACRACSNACVGASVTE